MKRVIPAIVAVIACMNCTLSAHAFPGGAKINKAGNAFGLNAAQIAQLNAARLAQLQRLRQLQLLHNPFLFQPGLVPQSNIDVNEIIRLNQINQARQSRATATVSGVDKFENKGVQTFGSVRTDLGK